MHSSCWNLVGPKLRRAFYLGLVALQPVSCVCSELLQAPKRHPLVPMHTSESLCPFICCHCFFLQDLFQKRKKTILFLASIVSSYHSNNSIGYSKFYLGFLKEYERRTGRRERFEEMMREFYKWSSRAEKSYTSTSYVKMLLWGRVGKALKM